MSMADYNLVDKRKRRLNQYVKVMLFFLFFCFKSLLEESNLTYEC